MEKRPWGPPPEGYIGGLGRGAVGFTTRSDIGTARNIGEYNLIKNSAMNAANKPITGHRRDESSGADSEVSEAKYDKWSGYEGSLFSNSSNYDEEDFEAENLYNQIDQYLDGRRRTKREEKQLDILRKMREEKPTIKQRFSDVRGDLAKLSKDDWENIPEARDQRTRSFVGKKTERYTPISDSLISQGLTDGAIIHSIDPKRDGFKTPFAPGSGTKTNLNEVGIAKSSVLSSVFDKVYSCLIKKISGTISGQTSVNPIGYLTELESTKIKYENNISDVKRARLLLRSVINTNPRKVAGWIAAARLEEFDGKLEEARNIIAQAADHILDSEDIWLEAARLNKKEDRENILGLGLRHNPYSEKIWLALAENEKDNSKKKAILHKGLENNPTSLDLWKEAIELEDQKNAIALLYKAVECIPENVDLWLALARQETYENARDILNRARKAIPTDPSIWIHAAKLQEANNPENCQKDLDVLISRALKTLQKNGVVIMKEKWHQEAENCELAGSPQTCIAIVRAIMLFDETAQENLYDNWHPFAQSSLEKACLITAKQIYWVCIDKDASNIDAWMSLMDLEKKYGDTESYENILKKAIESCKDLPIFWLMYAKFIWKSQSLNSAIDILKQGLIYNENDEEIILALVKLQRHNNNYKEARRLLEEARESLNTERIWMQSINLEREEADYERALELNKTALEKYPQFYKLWLILSQIYQHMEVNEMAIKTMEDALKTTIKKNETLYLFYCKLLLEINLEENEMKVRALLEEARTKFPKSENIWEQSILLELITDKPTSVIHQLIAKALKIIPTSGKIWALAIETADKYEKNPKAADALQKCEDNPYVMNAVARLNIEEKHFEKTRTWFNNSLTRNPDLGDTWILYYKFEKTFGDSEKANELLKRINDAEPHHGYLWTSVSKQVENWKRKPSEILQKASNLINFT